VQGKTFGPKGEEVTGGWREFRSEELLNLYWLQNIIRKVKWRDMGWVGLVYACEAWEMHTIFRWNAWKEEATSEIIA
jgi:hypothetical protein